jgi:hypothetical protein
MPLRPAVHPAHEPIKGVVISTDHHEHVLGQPVRVG